MEIRLCTITLKNINKPLKLKTKGDSYKLLPP